MKIWSDHWRQKKRRKKGQTMCQTYRGGIEGWLESVPGLYGGLIDRNQAPGLKEHGQTN